MKGIVIAMPSEATQILKDYVTDEHSFSTKCPHVVEREGKESFVYIISEIGKINAAIATQKLIDSIYALTEIINIGVCGATKATAKDHTIYIDSVVEADFDTSAIDGDEFELNCITFTNPKKRPDKYHILYTADHFTTHKPELQGHYIEGYFDMEGYAVAKAAQNAGIPCKLIKSVTDVIEDEGQASQYLINFDNACDRLREVLKSELDN